MKPCPNCESDQTYVADCCGYVICRKCGMTGPVAPVGNDEEAVKLWNALPRSTVCETCGNPIGARSTAQIIGKQVDRLELAQARINFLTQALTQVHQELRIGPSAGGPWRLRAMQMIIYALDGDHD